MKKNKNMNPVQVGFIGLFTGREGELEWSKLYVDIGNKRKNKRNFKKLYKKLKERVLKGCKDEH